MPLSFEQETKQRRMIANLMGLSPDTSWRELFKIRLGRLNAVPENAAVEAMCSMLMCRFLGLPENSNEETMRKAVVSRNISTRTIPNWGFGRCSIFSGLGLSCDDSITCRGMVNAAQELEDKYTAWFRKII